MLSSRDGLQNQNANMIGLRSPRLPDPVNGLGLPPKIDDVEQSCDAMQDSAPLPAPLNSNTCSACGQIFMGVHQICEHYRLTHGGQELQRPKQLKKHLCSVCGTSF